MVFLNICKSWLYEFLQISNTAWHTPLSPICVFFLSGLGQTALGEAGEEPICDITFVFFVVKKPNAAHHRIDTLWKTLKERDASEMQQEALMAAQCEVHTAWVKSF